MDKNHGVFFCCSLSQIRDYECSVHPSSVHPLGIDPLAVGAMMMGTGEEDVPPPQTWFHCILLSTAHLKMCLVTLSGFLNHLGRVIIGAENKLSLMHSSQELITKATTSTATVFESLCCAVLSSSVVSDFVTLWTQPTRLLCPWGFSRQEHWSGLPCPPPGDLPNPGIESGSLAL